MPSLQKLVSDIALCLVFFTRLPLPHFETKDSVFARAIWAAPVVGLAVALIGGVVYALAAFLGLAAGPAAALALAAAMAATGSLHEDGLSDTADGFGGGKDREKKLEIMRDSRIGAYGACALVFSVLLRWSAISELGSPIAVFCGLIAAHAASRALLPAFMQMLPPARTDGLSAGVGAISSDTAIAAAALGALALLALGLSGAVAAALCLGIVFFLFRALCLSQIGGQTGDTTGALQQAGEITVLLVASAVFI
ncbi:adenosylcobinamide-GDP ribazoletransferase [Allomesorhizobium camelthorni]|uniref:Adenosylcobinamide-GDP ribazoletransferase n=1 Tax=Allomesorhizobium camelthorni TaxID=475069 RepID=A0A6G4W8Q7_9HYPH|nr:adenosylcobinamide-GDP ribazoletransferase [Mesorhizobium camelthorni]NGO50540.1 adenosylcobinamide-GDP ribazoletransferase [Mesorhizobium camelthorni]